MENETKRNIETIFKELEELLYSIEGTEEEISKEALNYVEWMLKKAQLRYKYSRKEHSFPILYGRIYWAHLGVNVGSEEDKHRPVVIIKSERKSPIC